MITFLLLSTLCQSPENHAARRQLHFVNLLVDDSGAKKWPIKASIQPLVDVRSLGDARFPMDLGSAIISFDGPLQLCLAFTHALDRRRKVFFEEPIDKDLPLIVIRSDLVVRNMKGEELDRNQARVTIGLSKTVGKFFVDHKDAHHVFDLERVFEENQYQKVLSLLALSATEEPIKALREDEFTLELSYERPIPKSNSVREWVMRLMPSLRLETQDRKHTPTQLGITFCSQLFSTLRQHPSQQIQSATERFEAAKELIEQQDNRDQALIDKTTAYLEQSPTHDFAVILLVESMIYQGQFQNALQIMDQYELILHHYPQFVKLHNRLQAKMDLQHKKRLDERFTFEDKAPKGSIRILTPAQGDLVAGRSEVAFALADDAPNLLQVDLLLNGQLVGHCSQEPYRIPFRPDSKRHRLDIELIAYFEDRSMDKQRIWVKQLRHADQNLVHLAKVRAVVTRNSSQIMTNLDLDDFRIFEHDEKRPIRSFEQSKAPLRIAILLDTSSSMLGQKIHHAQYALRHFLNKLEAEDRVSLYTVDNQVTRLAPFSQDTKHLIPTIQTIMPRSRTSLTDAIYVAHHELMKQRGTKVMIVISDGEDNGSNVQSKDIMSLLDASPVQVYSVYLPSGEYYSGSGNAGKQFMENMSTATGSVFMAVEDIERLDETFTLIYKALKSFYLLDFYTNQVKFDPTSVRLKVTRIGSVAHFKPFFSLVDEDTPNHHELLTQSP